VHHIPTIIQYSGDTALLTYGHGFQNRKMESRSFAQKREAGLLDKNGVVLCEVLRN